MNLVTRKDYLIRLTKSCLMRDAEGKNLLDQEHEFCSSCKKYLKEKNWNLL